MTYKTHILGGVLAGLLVTRGVDSNTTVAVVTGVSAIASLIPDLDIPNSKIGNKAGVISKGINKAFGHRGLFHSPLLYIILAYLLQGRISEFILLGSLAGTLSHLLLDMFNSTGIPVFYPLSKSKISIAKIKTRSNGEVLFSVVLIGLIVYVISQYHLSTPNLVMKSAFEVPKFDINEKYKSIKLSEVLDLGNIKNNLVNLIMKLKEGDYYGL